MNCAALGHLVLVLSVNNCLRHSCLEDRKSVLLKQVARPLRALKYILHSTGLLSDWSANSFILAIYDIFFLKFCQTFCHIMQCTV